MRAIAILCLFFVLISTGTTFHCYKCSKDKRTTCKHLGLKTCGASKIGCLGAIGETNVVPKLDFFQTTYDCASVNQCLNGDFSISAANKKFLHVGSYCCKSERCNGEEPEYVPYEDLKPNGLQCPACFGETDKTTCNPEEMVKCVGNQTQCVNMRIRVIYGFYLYSGFLTINGCATPDVCTLKSKDDFNLGSVVITNKGTSCYEAMPFSDQADLGVMGV